MTPPTDLKDQSDEALNRRLLVALGWKLCHLPSGQASGCGNDPDGVHRNKLPKFTQSLDECARVRETLTEDQRYTFLGHLVGRSWFETWTFADVLSATEAKPRRIVEALIATLQPPQPSVKPSTPDSTNPTTK